MDASFSFSIKGRDFIINTHLNKNETTGWKFEKSNLSRFFYRGDEIGEGNIPKTQAKVMLENTYLISKKVPFPLQLLFVNKDELIHITPDAINIYPISFSIDENTRKMISEAKLQQFRYTRNINDEIIPANTVVEEQINAYVFTQYILATVPEIFSFNGVTVLSGERVWSGWLDTYSAINMLLKSGDVNGYYIFDAYAIWEYMIRDLASDKRLLELDKENFIPDLTYVNNIQSGDHVPYKNLKVVKGQRSKILHIIDQPFCFFDLGDDGFEIAESKYYLSRYVLIKNKAKCSLSSKILPRQKELFQSSCGKTRDVSYMPAEYLKSKKMTLTCRSIFPIKNWPKIGSGVYREKDMFLATTFNKKYIAIPDAAELCVSEDQLIVTGEVIYRLKAKNTYKLITSKYAGKVSLGLLKKGILVIESDRSDTKVASPWDGKVVSCQKPDRIDVDLEAFSFPIDNIFNYCFEGILAEWKNGPESAIPASVFKTILYIRKADDLEFSDFIFNTDRVSGIIINNPVLIKRSLLAKIKELKIPYIFIETTSKNLNPFHERILHQNIGQYISVKGNEIILPTSNLKNAEKFFTSPNDVKGNFKGSVVKFLNYQSDNLYGKIEKSSRSGNENLLINLPDGIFEARPENILLI